MTEKKKKTQQGIWYASMILFRWQLISSQRPLRLSVHSLESDYPWHLRIYIRTLVQGIVGGEGEVFIPI